LLSFSVKTNARLWWVFGMIASTSTTMAAPATCHHTETLFSTAIRWPLKMLSSAARARMMTNST
jgi:hypothetical protein